MKLTDREAMLETSFRKGSEVFDAVVEQIEVQPNYMALTILISQDVAVGTVIEAGIGECNIGRERIGPKYFVTNTRIPEPEEFLAYFEEA